MIRVTPDSCPEIRSWKRGEEIPRTYDQQRRNNSSAAYSLADALRRNQYIQRLARMPRESA